MAHKLSGRTLIKIGFDRVDEGSDLSHSELSKKLSDLTKLVQSGDTVFFFFSGHGVSIGGINYLLSVDMLKPNDDSQDYIRHEGHSVDTIIESIQRRGAKFTIAVLDSCRTNPFDPTGTRGVGGSQGLAEMRAPKGVFILYSAGIGQAALDRLDSDDVDEPNSVFTRKLLPLLLKPGMTQVSLAKQVQVEVDALAATVGHSQQPAYYDQIIGELLLNNNFLMSGKTAEIASAVDIRPPIKFKIKPGILIDSSSEFSEMTLGGARRWKAETGLNFYEEIIHDWKQNKNALRKLATDGRNPIVAVGFINADAMSGLADEFPKTNFVIVDMVVDKPNVRSVLFKENEGSYIVGVMAGIASSTGMAGFIGGMDIPLVSKFSCGYIGGFKSVNKKRPSFYSNDWRLAHWME